MENGLELETGSCKAKPMLILSHFSLSYNPLYFTVLITALKNSLSLNIIDDNLDTLILPLFNSLYIH